MVKKIDISLFFKTNCCVSKSSSHEVAPCRNSAQKHTPYDYMKYLYNKDCPLHITTITIGTKWLGKLSAKEQYKVFVKHIKKHIPFHAEDMRYIYNFELTSNGQLHAHGLEYNTYQNRFAESFSIFGKRNEHPKSFQICRNIDGYITYINKENVYPSITNIQRKHLADIPYQG